MLLYQDIVILYVIDLSIIISILHLLCIFYSSISILQLGYVLLHIVLLFLFVFSCRCMIKKYFQVLIFWKLRDGKLKYLGIYAFLKEFSSPIPGTKIDFFDKTKFNRWKKDIQLVWKIHPCNEKETILRSLIFNYLHSMKLSPILFFFFVEIVMLWFSYLYLHIVYS